MPYQRTAVFNQLPCPSLRSWLHRLKSAVFSVLQEDRSRGKSSTAHVNTFPMIRWVLRRMRDGGWTLLPHDKEPGFCFIRHSETREKAISSLVPGSYEESHFLDLWLPGMMKTYGVIAKGIGELHGKRTQSAVLSSQWSEGVTAICQIRLLCKTTKSPGEVTFRCVHSGVSNMRTGLSAWLAHHLRVKIEIKLPHLLRDTKEFVDDLRHLHWQDGMRMVKIDIKEFYMSGKPCFLSHACSELFCDETVDFQQLVAKAVDWLCRNQYVQSEFFPDLTFRVTRRSGMGLLHSGEVSDAGFWIAAERWLLTTSVRQWCSITYWRRFRDDIFAITSNFPRFKHVPRWLRSRAALEGYKLLTEDVSQNKITFLAVDVVVINGGFVTKPRERIVAPFLSEYSAHPRHVHISWPCSVAKSFGSSCLHQKEQRAAENDFLARLQRFFTCPTTISRVRRSLVERRPRVIKDKTPKNKTWLVLDYHPLCRMGGVSRATRKMFENPFKALLDHAW